MHYRKSMYIIYINTQSQCPLMESVHPSVRVSAEINKQIYPPTDRPTDLAEFYVQKFFSLTSLLIIPRNGTG